MLNARTADLSTTTPVRVVIDETSFDFRALEASAIERHLDDFNDAVWGLRDEGIAAWKPPMLESVPCIDGLELFEYLAGVSGTDIDRDTRIRFFGLLSKCPDWDASVPSTTDVAIGAGEPFMALSISFALTLALRRQGVACLVFAACALREFIMVSDELNRAEIFFFASASELPMFWRHLYELEDAAEDVFFDLAGRAFPELIFHADLNFRRFAGAYRELREPVVRHLAVLNDNFIEAYDEASGIARQVEAILASAGCPGISPESPSTHRNQQAMRARDVDHDGVLIRCEWHTKIEPNRNRIHFAFGGSLGQRVFIGIFTDHLPT